MSELLCLAILFSVTPICQEGNGSLGMMTMSRFKQTRSEVKELIKPKETAFQERETEQTWAMPLTCERVISDSLLPFPLVFLLRYDQSWEVTRGLKIRSSILRKPQRAPCNAAPHRGRISTGTNRNPPRPLAQQGFWNTESNKVFLVLLFSSELAALRVKTTRSRLTLPFKP